MQERKRYTLEEKRQHVAAWRSSGLTRQQYSELHDIKFSTFREWPQDIKTRVSNDSAGLIPVHIATDSAVTPVAPAVNEPVMHFLPGGIRVNDGDRRATEVDKELFTGTVLLAHGEAARFFPLPVAAAEVGVPHRQFACLSLILHPQQLPRYVGLSHLSIEVKQVWHYQF